MENISLLQRFVYNAKENRWVSKKCAKFEPFLSNFSCVLDEIICILTHHNCNLYILIITSHFVVEHFLVFCKISIKFRNINARHKLIMNLNRFWLFENQFAPKAAASTEFARRTKATNEIRTYALMYTKQLYGAYELQVTITIAIIIIIITASSLHWRNCGPCKMMPEPYSLHCTVFAPANLYVHLCEPLRDTDQPIDSDIAHVCALCIARWALSCLIHTAHTHSRRASHSFGMFIVSCNRLVLCSTQFHCKHAKSR